MKSKYKLIAALLMLSTTDVDQTELTKNIGYMYMQFFFLLLIHSNELLFQSGDCDLWQSPSQDSITSVSLHPTAKILLIAVSHHVYLWNWETSAQPTLFAASIRACEKVR